MIYQALALLQENVEAALKAIADLQARNLFREDKPNDCNRLTPTDY